MIDVQTDVIPDSLQLYPERFQQEFPATLSEAIKLAVQDVDFQRQNNPKFRLKMWDWAYMNNHYCTACFAGACIVTSYPQMLSPAYHQNSLYIDSELIARMDVRPFLMGLNAARAGHFYDAAREYLINSPEQYAYVRTQKDFLDELPQRIRFVEYDFSMDNYDEFRESLLKAAAELKTIQL